MSQPCSRKNLRSAIVALLPGRMTRSAIGSGSPGRTNTSRTEGSMRNGSKSSKLAMRASIGTAMVTAPSARGFLSPRPNASSAGSRAASAKNGSRPKARQCVCASSAIMPLRNRFASPRNLLTMKPTMVAASSGASAALTPRIWAKMPPRSMSPISATGQLGGAREAHIGDVALAQVDLGCAARALDEHEIGVRLHARVAVEHGAHQFGFERLIFARWRVADDLALDDDLRADFALGLEQNRVHVHARRNPACARLQRLGAADLAAVVRHRSVVRHVLRLERADAKPAPRESAAKPRDDQRLADVRSRALEHQRPSGQNSIASCARTPAAK